MFDLRNRRVCHNELYDIYFSRKQRTKCGPAADRLSCRISTKMDSQPCGGTIPHKPPQCVFSQLLEPLQGFPSNFVWIFLEWVPTKFVKIRVLLLFFMELWVILCNFWPILKKSSSLKPLTRNRSYFVWRVPRGSSL